jgi:hypothetical protein
MQNAAKRFCPFCQGEIPLESVACMHCERDLNAMKLAHARTQNESALYRVVPNGIKYGIAIAGEVKLHGMDLKEAQDLAALLNSVFDIPKTG